MALTHTAVKNAKPRQKAYRLYDVGGLYLQVTAAGGRLWRFKYRFGGKEKLLALGKYPDTSLKQARDHRDAARRLLAENIDPAAERQRQRQAQMEAANNTFQGLAEEWINKQSKRWTPGYLSKTEGRLSSHVFGPLGDRPIADITSADILATLKTIDQAGKYETAHRVRQLVGAVFRYAIATNRATNDPTVATKGSLSSWSVRHHAAIVEPSAVGQLLRAINEYQGSVIVGLALQLSPLLFLRPGELRQLEWAWIDFDRALISIPERIMKMRHPHLVPLASQAVSILLSAHDLTSTRTYVFPGVRNPQKPISENTVSAALRSLGYPRDVMTAHGFRATASTLLHEHGWNSDLIELQLAHRDSNTVRSVYNRADRLSERKKMMQWWADYLDKRREDNESVTL